MTDTLRKPFAGDAPSYPADKARQGEIVLRRPWQRMVFIAGLIGCAIVALLVGVLSGR